MPPDKGVLFNDSSTSLNQSLGNTLADSFSLFSIKRKSRWLSKEPSQ